MKHRRLIQNDFCDVLESPVGHLYLIFASGVLTSISFSKPSNVLLRGKEGITLHRKELTEYFEKGRQEFTGETAFIEGTEFEKKVWATLREIPYGETRTYKWLAEKIGRPHAFRAVGNALGKNPIPIIYPCHRVVETDGSIGGYSAGVDIKRRLLELEYYTKLAKK
jgi:methylated-DNA-[protein]-cysteine S-methyltransferase